MILPTLAGLFAKLDALKKKAPEEVTQQTLDGEKELLKRLKELDELYKNSQQNGADKPAPSLNLERAEPLIQSDAELKAFAEKEAERNAQNKAALLTAENQSGTTELEKRKKTLESQKNKDIEALFAAVDELKKQAENDALKRGLARSSIALGRRNELDDAKIEGMEKYSGVFYGEAAEIDRKIADLRAGFEKSVSDLEFEKAYEAEKKLGQLIKERDKLVEETLKYNNTLTEKENAYKMQYNKYAAEMREKEKTGVEDAGADEKYYAAYEFYSGLDRESAKKLIEGNAYLKAYLGVNNYNKLKKAIEDR